jgi:putative endonuclease
MPMVDDKEFGKKGEELAARYLSRRGYRILEKNYRSRAGELDIVAMDGKTLVFVEVKSRRSNAFGSPGDAVNARKRRQMERVALAYMTENKKDGLHCRFDVVGITAAATGEPEVELVKDAFEVSGGY